jgi:hypothetical protein
MSDERAPDERRLAECVDELSAHPEIERLAELVKGAALAAAAARRADFVSPRAPRSQPEPPPDTSLPLTTEAAETPLGNVLAVLERGVQNARERKLLAALLAIGIARDFPEAGEQQQTLVANLVWLEAHTATAALGAMDQVLSERSGALWEATARVARTPSAIAADFGRTEALTAAAALAQSSSEVAGRALIHLSQSADDALVRAFASGWLAQGDSPELRGELAPAPFGPVVTALLAVTLLLFAYQAARAIGRVVFAYRRPATLRLGSNGLELTHRTELMGKVLRERAVLVPLSNLARVTREVRYARAGLYAGLTALVLGTYYGTGYFVDGLLVTGGGDRAQLVGMAVLLIVAGLALDFVLSSAADSARGRCRVVVVQRKGRPLCVGALDPMRTDAMLAGIAEAAKG